MFFAKPGQYNPCGLFGIGHFVLFFVTIITVIILLKIVKIHNNQSIKNIIKHIIIFCWIMEIIKIVFNIKIGNINNINTYIPLYFCSIFLYAGIFSLINNPKIKRVGDVFLATGNFVGGIVFLVFPTTSLPTYPVFHYISLQSFIYHGCMVFVSLLILKYNYIELKKTDSIYYFLLFILVSIVVLIINNIYGSNLMFISQNFPGTFINVLYNLLGKFFTPFMILIQSTVPFWIMYLLNEFYIKIKDFSLQRNEKNYFENKLHVNN